MQVIGASAQGLYYMTVGGARGVEAGHSSLVAVDLFGPCSDHVPVLRLLALRIDRRKTLITLNAPRKAG